MGEEWTQIGDFAVDINQVTKQEFINMRKYLPREDYRLFKNRKSARICRQKKKIETTKITTSN